MMKNLRLAGAFAALATLAFAISCRGFFQNPTISSLAVGPSSPTIETGTTNNTVQMTVFGTNNDGSTTSNPSVSWSITPTTTATISSSGLVTSVALGTATVTATSNQNPSITGTQSVTVTVGCITSIQISGPTTPLSESNPEDDLTATAATCNGSVNLTDVATWNSNNLNLATVSDGAVSFVSTTTTSGTVTITASSGNITSNAINIQVTASSSTSNKRPRFWRLLPDDLFASLRGRPPAAGYSQ